jgi:lipoprotein-anchoring transpeptidase ErfK/SrfK
MQPKLSRRDFLKLSGLTLGGLAFSPFLPGLTDFDDSFVVRIGTVQMPVREKPKDDSRIYQTWYRDDLVHVYEEVVAEEPKYNPVWYRVWGGFLHRGRLQRVKTVYQKPVNIPEGRRLLAEVTVPFTMPYRYSKAYGWQALTPAPPLYYSSVHWVDSLTEGPQMADYNGPWYRIFDELDSNVPYYVPAIHMRMVPLEYFDPISPNVPDEEKLIEVNLTTQMVTAYEYGKPVFKTNVSTGIPGGGLGGPNGLSTTTPDGKFNIVEKMPSKHMGYSYFNLGQGGNLLADESGYVLPGIPWTSFIAPPGKPTAGHAFHGTYWHENFGTPMSHGCINMRNHEANWIFRWAKPPHDTVSVSNHRGIGTLVDLHY